MLGIVPKKEPLPVVRQFTARKPFLFADGIVGALAVAASIAPDWGFTIARGWLAALSGILFFLLVVARIAGDKVREERDRIREEREAKAHDLVVDIHSAVVQGHST